MKSEVNKAVATPETAAGHGSTNTAAVETVQPSAAATTTAGPNTGAMEVLDPRIEVLPTGARFIGQVSRSRVREFMKEANQKHKSAALGIGDAAHYIQEEFGYGILKDLAKELGIEYSTVRTWKWIAESVPLEIRVESLSLEHHRVVAKLEPPAEMTKYLKMAIDERLNADQLKQRINGTNSGKGVVNFDAVWRKAKGLAEVVKQKSLKLDDKERESLRAKLQELLDFVAKPENFSGKRSKTGNRNKGTVTKPAAADNVAAVVDPFVMPVPAAVVAAAVNPAQALAASASAPVS